ncbi:Component of the SF3b subcomplex of the U2 snRNP [Savitreella phatthalungensis]
MPRIKTNRAKRPPEGFAEVEPVLEMFAQKMKDVEQRPHDKSSKTNALAPIFQVHNQRSRYLFDMYYDRQVISRELFDWLLKQGYGDANLIAKWKKQGYEKLCCLRCIQNKETNFETTCVCRVPRAKLAEQEGDGDKINPCYNCGCMGCASGD